MKNRSAYKQNTPKQELPTVMVCRHCWCLVSPEDFRTHLKKKHTITERKPRHLTWHFYTVRMAHKILHQKEVEKEQCRRMAEQRSAREQLLWYHPNSTQPEFVCGTVIHGAPQTRIIYTSMESNRHKH
jgi:hypothetical protein